ncbi:hypothetical protein [Noviherbaspirillum pedocola]|uniref:Lipoprotein n=1 Tax=Noviherbaspirillum pedocola TaxID=2801341 RepID=A0A934W7V2_9BURK|nr:hypothetical protein [Noviherbaspirillum pedocola]MBK4735084.1 hypothetical protein [Noviherbaspirillum pedocola]
MGKASWASICMVVALGACGGGSSNGDGLAAATPAGQQEGNATVVQRYTNEKAVQGDSFTRKETYSFSDSNSKPLTSYFTNYYQTVNADHSGLFVQTNSDPMFIRRRYYFTADGITKDADASEQPSCVSEPSVAAVPSTLTPGQRWDNSWTRTCTTGTGKTVDMVRNTGSATALETITVAAGTFQTIKEENTWTEILDASRSTAKLEQVEQCWIDTVMGVAVKCTQTAVATPRDTSLKSKSGSATIELIAYDASRFPGSIRNPARFAGGWNAGLTEANTENCSSLTIDTKGELTGTCRFVDGWYVAVEGAVDADGVLKASSSDGVTISGKLTPVDGSVEWSANGGRGAWSMAHK